MTWNLAQVNIGRMVAPEGDPRVQPFYDALDRINAVADASPGFVWRLQSDSGNATDISVFDDPLMLINMSVWTDVESLQHFVYKTDHAAILRRRTEWFERETNPIQALWWIPAGQLPTAEEGRERIEFLRRIGPSPYAFGPRDQFPKLTVRPVGIDDSDAQTLIGELNAEIKSRHQPGFKNFFTLTAADVAPGNGVFLVVEADDEPIACGAIRMLPPGAVNANPARTAEVKRMYVRPSGRGRKLGHVILHHLRQQARVLGCTRLVLETGAELPEAQRLYKRDGFDRVEPWGEYRDSPNSLCFGQDI